MLLPLHLLLVTGLATRTDFLAGALNAFPVSMPFAVSRETNASHVWEARSRKDQAVIKREIGVRLGC